MSLPKPYYQDEYSTIYCADCRDILPHLEPVDLLLTDPPYGIGWHPRTNHMGKDRIWLDNERPATELLLCCGKGHIIWGGQFFALPISGEWLCWVKRPLHCNFSNDARTYSTIELAWTDCVKKSAFMAITWDGGMRAGNPENRSFCHPSQKPIELMQRCIVQADKAQENKTILDPFMGSGTTLVAAKNLGRKAIGIELEEKYCEIAVKRLSQGVLPFEGAI